MAYAVKGPGNITVTYNSQNITAYCDSAEIAATVAELETTNLGSTAQTFIPGLGSWNFNFSIVAWDNTIEGYLMPDVITPTARTLAIAVTDGNSATKTYTWTTAAFLTGLTITAAANGLIGAKPAIRCSGIPSRA
jgi:hypothetical protein